MALIVGLTGGMGVGKSTVAALLAAHGAEVVDVDGIGHEILGAGSTAVDAVVATFGPGLLDADGSVDRGALAALVFGPDNRLAELEAISHPAINERLLQILALSKADVVVLDMAVLVESELAYDNGSPIYSRVLVVEAPLETRLDRLQKRGLSAEQALARMSAQVGDMERRLLADVVLVNDAELSDLVRKVDELWPTVQAWQIQSEVS